MRDVEEFLRRHPPFDTLDDAAAAEVAAAAEPESYAAGSLIIGSPDATSESAYVVRTGGVELVGDGRLLDHLGEGELFGFASILAESPLGFVARAAEDTEVYRLPEDAIRRVLERPAALRFVARALTTRLLAGPQPAPAPRPMERPVDELVRAPPPVCPPATSVRDAARRMVESGASCVLVDLDPGYGIVTDRDLRTRVLAEGAGPDTPLADVMTAPARAIAADRTGSEALLEMLDHGVRHLPVLDAHRRLVGVLDDFDLLASEHRAPFRLRALIARARDPDAVARAAAELTPAVIALHDAGATAPAVSRMIAGVHDAVVRRLIDLATQESGTSTAAFSWLALGSFGRREPFPSSDVDCALAWEGGDDGTQAALMRLARKVLAGLVASGFRADAHGAVASSALFARSAADWEAAMRAWAAEPDRRRGLMLLTVTSDAGPVWGAGRVSDRLARAFARAPQHDAGLRRMAVAALAERPPTGFLRNVVIEPGGVRRKTLDIKRGGLLPVESLARWAALAAGATATSTSARLEAAAAAGTLSRGDAATLLDALELFSALRMEHQVEQLRNGRVPDDVIDPGRLTPLSRGSLKQAFRAVARVQRGLNVELSLSGR